MYIRSSFLLEKGQNRKACDGAVAMHPLWVRGWLLSQGDQRSREQGQLNGLTLVVVPRQRLAKYCQAAIQLQSCTVQDRLGTDRLVGNCCL
jgi:hypothetical protein